MVLKSKMKVLVDKIEEYRATEDSMRLTLLSAQKLSMQIEEEARKKAEELLAGARAEAERITREAHTQRTAEEATLLEAKRESTQYIETMRMVCTKQLDFLDGLKRLKLEGTPQPAAAEALNETVRSIESSVQQLSDSGETAEEIRRVVTDRAEGPVSSLEEPTRLFPSGGAVPAGQFSFDSLRFGK